MSIKPQFVLRSSPLCNARCCSSITCLSGRLSPITTSHSTAASPPQLEPQSKRKPAEVDVSLPKQPLWGLPEPSLPGAQLSVCDGARSVDVLSRPRPPSLHLCLPKSPDCTPVTIQSPRSHSPLIWRSTNSALFLKRRLTNPTHTYHRPAALFSLPDVSASSFFGQDLQWSSKA